jgi:hypothetical protein
MERKIELRKRRFWDYNRSINSFIVCLYLSMILGFFPRFGEHSLVAFRQRESRMKGERAASRTGGLGPCGSHHHGQLGLGDLNLIDNHSFGQGEKR